MPGINQTISAVSYADTPTNGEVDRALISLEKIIDQNNSAINTLRIRLEPISTPNLHPSSIGNEIPTKEGPPISPIAHRLKNLEAEVSRQNQQIAAMIESLEL